MIRRRTAAGDPTQHTEYPGPAVRMREPLFTGVHVVVDQVADVAAPVREDGPVIFFGHSLGAAVAYEAVRRTPDRRQVSPQAACPALHFAGAARTSGRQCPGPPAAQTV
ncbi:thioesterase domain-containing protein [Streptomyces fuscichromogenes]|uniref:thioesterase domain-containing protein n=1 Tax=Streptomyces fuscichromogenes TaxID=1324013 RepID=UPI0038307041